MMTRTQKAVVATAIIAVGLCFLLPFTAKPRKFPYTGYWVGTIENRKDNFSIKATLGFHKDGSCTYNLAGTTSNTNYDCAYEMQERKAFVQISHVSSDKQGDWKTESHLEVSPEDKGKILKLKPLMIVQTTLKSGKQKTLNFEPEVIEMQKKR